MTSRVHSERSVNIHLTNIRTPNHLSLAPRSSAELTARTLLRIQCNPLYFLHINSIIKSFCEETYFRFILFMIVAAIRPMVGLSLLRTERFGRWKFPGLNKLSVDPMALPLPAGKRFFFFECNEIRTQTHRSRSSESYHITSPIEYRFSMVLSFVFSVCGIEKCMSKRAHLSVSDRI